MKSSSDEHQLDGWGRILQKKYMRMDFRIYDVLLDGTREGTSTYITAITSPFFSPPQEELGILESHHLITLSQLSFMGCATGTFCYLKRVGFLNIEIAVEGNDGDGLLIYFRE